MRKLLLSLFMMVAVVATAFAQTVTTFDFTKADADGKIYGFAEPNASATGTNLANGTLSSGNINIESTKVASNDNRLWFNAKTGIDLRCYSGSYLTFSTTDDEVIVKIEFTGAAIATANLSFDYGTYTSPTWTGSAKELRMTFKATSQFKTMVITTQSSSATPQPTFSVAPGNYTTAQTVEIKCTDTAAKIYYTIDGEVPTISSTEYTEPISISTTTTLKAIAANGDNISAVSTATYEFPISVSTVADFIALSDGTLATISIPLSVVYQNGSRLFVTDGTDGLLIYGSGLGKTYTNGQSIPAGATGERATFSGVIEMTNMIASTFGDGVASEEVAPISMDISDVTVADQNKYVVFSKVKYEAAGKLVSGTGELATYNQFGITIPEDLTLEYDVTGILTVRNSAPQLYLLDFKVTTGIQGTEASAATIIGGYSQIEINATENAEVLIVNTLGQAVASKTISAGATTVGVAPGLYIVKVNNTVSKVVVK